MNAPSNNGSESDPPLIDQIPLELEPRIKEFFGKLLDWKNLNDLIPTNFLSENNLRRSGTAGMFAASLELAKEGDLSIKQNKLFDDIYIKEKQ